MKTFRKLALVTAIAAPLSAMANGPTLYGTIDTSMDSIDNGNDTELNFSSNRSRIGVKGGEELDNGMKVGYKIEWEVDSVDDGRDLVTRDRYINLSGDFGTVQVGKFNVPFKSVGRKTDLFTFQIGDKRNLTPLELRARNIIAYVTPRMSGLQAVVGYITDVGAGGSDDNSNSAWSANLTFKQGGMWAGLGYINLDEGATAIGATDSDAFNVGFSAKMADMKVNLSWATYNDFNGAKGDDFDVWGLGFAYKMGSNTLKAQYTDSTGDRETSMWSLGIDHKMSRRTKLYFAYAENDDANGTSVYRAARGVTTATAAGEDTRAFSVGIVHKF